MCPPLSTLKTLPPNIYSLSTSTRFSLKKGGNKSLPKYEQITPKSVPSTAQMTLGVNK